MTAIEFEITIPDTYEELLALWGGNDPAQLWMLDTPGRIRHWLKGEGTERVVAETLCAKGELPNKPGDRMRRTIKFVEIPRKMTLRALELDAAGTLWDGERISLGETYWLGPGDSFICTLTLQGL